MRSTTISGNTAPVAPNVFQNGAGGNFTVDGQLIPPGYDNLSFSSFPWKRAGGP